MLEKAFIIAFLVQFIWASFLPGMIFGRVQTWFAPLRTGMKKMLFSCSICMTPWWGTGLYWLLFHQTWQDWLLTVFVAGGISTVFVKLYPYSD